MKKFFSAALLFCSSWAISQTTITLPEESQHASVTQRIGITDITVDYHSPAVKGRKIWGELVPDNELWRAGANQNTVVSFTHDVSIGGQALPAGKYGLHMMPDKGSWTVIFSKNYTSWGSYFYRKDEDALRVTVKQNDHAHTEWLSYTFTDRSANQATLALQWEKIEIPIPISVDVNNIVLANMKNELRTIPGFTWEGWYEAANFCYRNHFNTAQALKWADRADRSKPGHFPVLRLKAALLKESGNAKSADSLMQVALATADETGLNTYGYELLNEGKHNEALEVFKTNLKRHPASWNAYDSMAEALARQGDKPGAIKHYELALKKAPDPQKKRIEASISSLRASN